MSVLDVVHNMRDLNLFTVNLITLIVLSTMLMSMNRGDVDETVEDITVDSTDYWKTVAEMYKQEYIESIVDPAVRLKMVAGIPKEEAITWKQKVIHEINTRAITRWRPDSLHHYYDEETGTWNKPSSYH